MKTKNNKSNFINKYGKDINIILKNERMKLFLIQIHKTKNTGG